MAELVYLLCMVTSVVCAGLLIRSYRRTRSRLLLWSTMCFVGLAVNNALLVLDLVVHTSVDLSSMRAAAALVGISVMVVGLIWESR